MNGWRSSARLGNFSTVCTSRAHVLNSCGFDRVKVPSFSVDGEPQEFPREDTESAFQRVHPQIVSSTSDEVLPRILHLLVLLFKFFDDIIYIVFQVVVKYVVKDDSHSSLTGGTSVLESERFDCVVKIAHRSLGAVFLALRDPS